ncbi:hypothetical protein ACQBAT_00695 [Ornithinimicrobium sp. Y1847]
MSVVRHHGGEPHAVPEMAWGEVRRAVNDCFDGVGTARSERGLIRGRRG